MTYLDKRSLISSRRRFIQSAGGMVGALALGAPPIIAQSAPKKLIVATTGAKPELSAVMLDWFCDQLTKRSNGSLQMEFAGMTILTKEIDIVNAVKAGNVALGTPVGAAATIFPEMGVFLIPYLVSSYEQAYQFLNGEVGDQLDKLFQEKYGVKVVFFYDQGFRHFYNWTRPITTPRDLRGLKMRVQPAKIYSDSINGLGGIAVPVPGAEMYMASQQRLVDGGDAPVANMAPFKLYEVSKYYSLTGHNYGSTLLVANLQVWKTLTSDEQKLMLTVGREAQQRHVATMKGAENLASAKASLEPHGMIVNAADVNAFKQVAKDKVWPLYKDQYKELWQKLTG